MTSLDIRQRQSSSTVARNGEDGCGDLRSLTPVASLRTNRRCDPNPAARWMWPLVLCASGVLWALIAHLLAHG
jgi:hypothetical protein